MKIKRVYFKEMIINLGHKNNVDSSLHKIDMLGMGFLIDDKILIPFSNCKEVLVEPEAIEPEPKKKSK